MQINNIDSGKPLNLSNEVKVGKERVSFVDTMRDSLSKVNDLQHNSNQMGKDLSTGKVDNVHDVMVAAQKAKLSLDLTASITKKAVDAYQEIMRMQL